MALPIQKLGALAVRLGFSLAAEATKPITITTGGVSGAYDPATDTMAYTGGVATVAQALEYKRAKKDEPNNQISEQKFATELKVFMVPVASLPPGAEIDRGTLIVDGAVRWYVLLANIDPAKAAWIIDVGV